MNSHPVLDRRAFLKTTGTVIGWAATTHLLGAQAASRGPSTGFQIGCYTRPWDQYEYRVALDGIAEAGFRWAGIMTAKGKSWVVVTVDSTPDEVAAISRAAMERGLKILSIYGGDFPVAKSVAAGISGLKTLVDHCCICSCPQLLLGGTTDGKLFEAYYKVVAECCDYAAEKGVMLTIKPHGGQNATGPQCRRIIERVGHKNFRLWYDPGNIFYYSDGKLDPVDDSATVDGLVAGVSVKDFTPPKEVLVTPGTGKVRFEPVLRNLSRGGFRQGPLIIECLAKADSPAKVTAEARRARAFLENLASQLS